MGALHIKSQLTFVNLPKVKLNPVVKSILNGERQLNSSLLYTYYFNFRSNGLSKFLKNNIGDNISTLSPIQSQQDMNFQFLLGAGIRRDRGTELQSLGSDLNHSSVKLQILPHCICCERCSW